MPDLVERELPNIRAALDHAAGAPDPDHNGLRLMTALAFFWTQRGYAAEGADYSLRVLAGDPAAPPALRARARWAGAYDRFYTFDLDRAMAAANTALEEAREAGDEATQGRCLHVLAAATFMVDPGASRPLFESSLELARASGDRWAEADSLQFLGFSYLLQHRPAPAGELLAQSGAMADEMGNAFQQAWQHIAFGSAKADVGELADAARNCEQASASHAALAIPLSRSGAAHAGHWWSCRAATWLNCVRSPMAWTALAGRWGTRARR